MVTKEAKFADFWFKELGTEIVQPFPKNKKSTMLGWAVQNAKKERKPKIDAYGIIAPPGYQVERFSRIVVGPLSLAQHGNAGKYFFKTWKNSRIVFL